jgi:hypothetical protein
VTWTPHYRSARLRQRRRLRHRRHTAPQVVVFRTRRLARTCSRRISVIGAMTLVTVQRDGFSTVLPSFGSPRLFPLGCIRRGQPWVGLRGPRRPRRCGLDLLSGSPNRPSGGRRSRSNGASESSHNGRRQSYGHEQVGRIHVVLAGLVDDSNVPLTRSVAVGGI